MAVDVSKIMLDVAKNTPDMLKFGYLTNFFKTKAGDISEAEEIEFDIERSDEDIAPVLSKLGTGGHVISREVYTNKKIVPPAFCLQEPFNAYDLAKRQAGETVYDAGKNLSGKLASKIMDSWMTMTNMIKRKIGRAHV